MIKKNFYPLYKHKIILNPLMYRGEKKNILFK